MLKILDIVVDVEVSEILDSFFLLCLVSFELLVTIKQEIRNSNSIITEKNVLTLI